MNLRLRIIAGSVAFVLTPLMMPAQMTPWFQWVFLPASQMDLIIGEASGETAFGHVLALGGTPRNRKKNEYSSTFPEAQYVFDLLKEYGLDDATIIRFPGGEAWDGESGELWEVSPRIRKHASYMDLRAMLVSGSTNSDVVAELIWVGEGEPKDLEGLSVEGKIVMTSGSVAKVHALACLQKGAAGVISFASPRPLFDSLLIPWQSIGGNENQAAKFAFHLPPREGIILRDRLRREEKINVRAIVRSSRLKYKLEDVVATIPGTDPASGEIILTAHLFEGFEMQGANDNSSGCAAILEAARTLRALIFDGRLPAPRRTIRFLWAYEGNGTAAYVNANKELMRRTLCNINLDMVGLRLSSAGAFFTLMRTSYGNPHFINDIMENYYRFVGETSRTYVNNGSFSITEPRIVAPSGSEEPMYYYMGTHYGSSDHEVFNDWGVGVPGVIMNTWPDPWLHTSEDRPDKIDPTQLKRAVVIAAAAAYTVAAADTRMAAQIAAEVASNASGRIGHQLARALEEIKRADRECVPESYKKVRGYIEAAAINERSTLDSVRQLASDENAFIEYLGSLKNAIRDLEQSALKILEGNMTMTGRWFGFQPASVSLTAEEQRAAEIVPQRTTQVRNLGFEGYLKAIEQISSPGGVGPPNQGQRRIEAEIQLLCNGKNTVLDIKKMLDTQFRQQTSFQIILGHLERLKKAELIVF